MIARTYYSVDLDILRYFCDVLSTGISSCAGDRVIVLLWQWLVQNPGSNWGAKLQRYAKTERCLHAVINGEKLEKLYATDLELFPLPKKLNNN